MILNNFKFLFFFFGTKAAEKKGKKCVCVCEEKMDCTLKKIVAIQAFR
jgi:hypothetical protein